MNTLLRKAIAFAVLFALSSAACEERNGNAPGYATNSNATGAANSNAAPHTPATKPPDPWAVTLPVLAAFLADQDFVTQAKSDLHLTDQQVQRLQEVSYKAAAELQDTEESNGEHLPESEFRKRADTEIKRVIGEEKGERLLSMLADKWTGSEPGLRIGPGAVPSDTRIVINIPAFRMDLFDSGKLIKSYRVGIGYPEFPLPTGLRHAEQIIFNPPWIPPDSPWVDKMGSKIQSGKTIKPGSRLNPLGLLKVPIGFAALIHGGKPLSKIGTYASHGCVGLTNSQVTEFAQYLARMGGAQLTEQQIAQYGKDRTKSHTVKLASPVPVELRYDTIVLEAGNLHIYPDVYYRGTNTEQNLRSALEFQGVKFEQLNDSERNQALSALQQMNSEMPVGESSKSIAPADSTANGQSRNGQTNVRNTRYPSRKSKRKQLPEEIVVPTPSLSGRGYPEPVDLNTGRRER